jgi:hypothetical protein
MGVHCGSFSRKMTEDPSGVTSVGSSADSAVSR